MLSENSDDKCNDPTRGGAGFYAIERIDDFVGGPGQNSPDRRYYRDANQLGLVVHPMDKTIKNGTGVQGEECRFCASSSSAFRMSQFERPTCE